MEKDASFVAEVVKLLVEHPESVEVNRKVDDLGVLITLRVHPDDMATIIGREGRSAKAIRTLLHIIGAKEDQRVNLKIIEPEGQSEGQFEGRADSQTKSQPTTSEPAAPTTSDFMDDIPEPLA